MAKVYLSYLYASMIVTGTITDLYIQPEFFKIFLGSRIEDLVKGI